MTLLIDTTRTGTIRVGLKDRRLHTVQKAFDGPVRGQLLNVIDEVLRKHCVSPRDLRGIIVAIGPGPFSALRSACAVANAMSYALRIPAVGVRGECLMRSLAEQGIKKLPIAKVGTIIVPFYGRPAHITKPKRRA
ncbi:MAG: hypothetical protein V1907_02175 [Candidatus Kerfeldbacteria bacterium]